LGHVGLETDVGDVHDLFHRIGQGPTVRGQQALDLVVGIPALLVGVTRMQDGGACSRRTALIFRADAGQLDWFAWAVDGDNLAEPTLGPLRRVVAPDLQALRQHRGLRGDRYTNESG